MTVRLPRAGASYGRIDVSFGFRVVAGFRAAVKTVMLAGLRVDAPKEQP
jgi:hypothetical protein